VCRLVWAGRWVETLMDTKYSRGIKEKTPGDQKA
jgi:hypothetical protein